MRIALFSCIIMVIGLVSGCGSGHIPSRSGPPILTGKLHAGTFWKTSLLNSTTANEGGGYDQGRRVEVYDQFVVVTTSDGVGSSFIASICSGLGGLSSMP